MRKNGFKEASGITVILKIVNIVTRQINVHHDGKSVQKDCRASKNAYF
jgi:hypothetical protein